MNKNVIKSENFKKRIEEAFKEAKVKRDAISIKGVKDLSGKMIPPTKKEKLNMVASFYKSLEKLQYTNLLSIEERKLVEDIKKYQNMSIPRGGHIHDLGHLLELTEKIAILNSSLKKNLEDIKMQKVYFTDGEIYNYPKKPNN